MAENHAASTPAHSSRFRLVTVTALVPAFPLLLAHGIVSGEPVPVVGLVPLAISAGSSALLVRASLHGQDDDEGGDEEDGHEAHCRRPSSNQDDGEASDTRPQRWVAAALRRPPHPIALFLADAMLAAAFMAVLVLTWTTHHRSRRQDLSMLAAYATIPLLVCFLVHLRLALGALYDGLAIYSLTQWLAWRAVPPDCPNCHARLRPSLPRLPWLTSLGRGRRRPGDYAPVLTEHRPAYRDEPAGEQPEAVEVRRKGPKGKTAPVAADQGATPWGS